MINTGGIDVYLGLDVGKGEHHATAPPVRAFDPRRWSTRRPPPDPTYTTPPDSIRTYRAGRLASVVTRTRMNVSVFSIVDL
ncbi:hypothetical protein [Protofrankia symbiont of Coriaria ruscifolia]|uniref:hypothetical protein n=1 Tax=Protofrankia symbiont of Coriaria ruscifolia TaxID=1306542 RepID=UPI001041AA77|nr:hypothetical protein [Protofrankia symbiont of Coriaria ruscifolia]